MAEKRRTAICSLIISFYTPVVSEACTYLEADDVWCPGVHVGCDELSQEEAPLVRLAPGAVLVEAIPDLAVEQQAQVVGCHAGEEGLVGGVPVDAPQVGDPEERRLRGGGGRLAGEGAHQCRAALAARTHALLHRTLIRPAVWKWRHHIQSVPSDWKAIGRQYGKAGGKIQLSYSYLQIIDMLTIISGETDQLEVFPPLHTCTPT